MTIKFVGLPSDQVAQAKSAGRDAYDLEIEVDISPGQGIPCRHCLQTTPKGDCFLTLAWRPFEGLNPYTETGPIFLCAEDCQAAEPSDKRPEILSSSSYILRGYTFDERIQYGTGQVVETDAIQDHAQALLADQDIAFVDVRSASNNCFLCRIERA